MKTTLRPAEERGHFDHGWLNTYHSFSFGDYQDPDHVRFRSLRVINEDFVAPNEGFPPHGHQSMEIVTYILEGSLQHQDSMGNGSIIRPGDVQRMSAGSGVQHSEVNPSKSEKVHLLQIWIFPEKKGGDPGYEQTHFDRSERTNRLRLVASPNGKDGSVKIQQDAMIFASLLDSEKSVTYTTTPERGIWIHLAKGEIQIGEHQLRAGDGLAIEEATQITIAALQNSELLLFDLK